MTDALVILAAYLIGSLSFAVIVSRAYGLPDPRSYGSGNPGATNVLRTGRRQAAVLTLVGDAAKGGAAVLVAQALAARFDIGEPAVAAVALAAFIGHLWPVFFGFQGGKGVATAGGILLAVDPWLGGGTVATWLIFALIFRISSLAALVAAVFAPCWYVWLFGIDAMAGAVLLIALLLIWRHKANIARLLSGKESRLGRGANRPEKT
ncbi:MAG: glycerol-3-phosphate acyltransferase [Betaproteobacteria bacterium RIFCSPLOWO2_02_FULL_65_24]|nr:MAG: glycerol-3-phosphate acyltransferase [Betaproteobacteria bacterium RIFCSPLOWO2_02_FULL_65_24]OGA36476.1 MAG: glycerol-3-phosphate acyltransferase [Betaproteobacteria bacterium RIFCSPLOWO2_12_FULL_62_13b]